MVPRRGTCAGSFCNSGGRRRQARRQARLARRRGLPSRQEWMILVATRVQGESLIHFSGNCHETPSQEILVGRHCAGHRRVCRDVGGDFGSCCWDNPARRLKLEHRFLERGELDSVGFGRCNSGSVRLATPCKVHFAPPVVRIEQMGSRSAGEASSSIGQAPICKDHRFGSHYLAK